MVLGHDKGIWLLKDDGLDWTWLIEWEDEDNDCGQVKKIWNSADFGDGVKGVRLGDVDCFPEGFVSSITAPTFDAATFDATFGDWDIGFSSVLVW